MRFLSLLTLRRPLSLSLARAAAVDEIGAMDKELRKEIKKIALQNNSLTSLIELSSVGGVPMFTRVESITAGHNQIQWLCSQPEAPFAHGWPLPMLRLTELKLGDNNLTQLPEMWAMPNLQVLDLRFNFITVRSRSYRFFFFSLSLPPPSLTNLFLPTTRGHCSQSSSIDSVRW